MADKRQQKIARLNSKEPVFIIKPAFKNFGLDYLHIALLALVIILILLAFALSAFKQSVVVVNCRYGNVNSTSMCNSTVHNTTQVLAAAEKALAAYSSVNTTLSLIPYYSLVNQSRTEYLSNEKEWLVIVPYIDPLAKNMVFNISILLYDSNLSIASSYLQSIKPQLQTNNSVVGLGTVNLYGESACTNSKPIPIYVITDPYAPGMLSTLSTAINASRHYNGSIDVNYYYIFGGYSQHFYNGYGVNQTQELGRYLYCASQQQSRLPQFVSNLSIAYTGAPLSNITLYQVSLGSGLNATKLGSCIQNSTRSLNIQAQFANLYKIVSTPTIIVNCRYSTIPQTLNYSINYSLMHLNS